MGNFDTERRIIVVYFVYSQIVNIFELINNQMAKWSVSDEMDEQGRKNLTIQKGRKTMAIKMNEGEADKLVRFILNKFND